jgi:hypothetical protein
VPLLFPSQVTLPLEKEDSVEKAGLPVANALPLTSAEVSNKSEMELVAKSIINKVVSTMEIRSEDAVVSHKGINGAFSVHI